ncbi:uncharacterized protein LOC141535155 [Cotesia typhae]|uniref:uncharacterized protein LOC141535155 n=1 Tax=Cotesia typhae TaxID=2053667 RepID=UPI003D696E74
MTKPKKNINPDNNPKESTSSAADLLERQENNNNDSSQVDDGNQEPPEESPIELSSSEFIKSLKPSSSTIEIVGRVVRIFPTRRHVNQETNEVSFVFKFVLSNDDQESVQVSVWNDEIDRVVDKITNNAIVHIDGAFSKFIGKNLYYNYSTVEIELFIQSNTQVNVIRKVASRPVSQEKQSLPLVEIENCDGYINKKICVQGYIKTQLNIARIRGKDFARDSCVGSIANKNKYKLEIKIINFADNFISPFLKGEPVEIITAYHTNIEIGIPFEDMGIDDFSFLSFSIIDFSVIKFYNYYLTSQFDDLDDLEFEYMKTEAENENELEEESENEDLSETEDGSENEDELENED